MPEDDTNEKKKQKIMVLIGLVTLLIAVLGATYAFFQLDTDTESSNTTITGSTPDKSLVTLNQEISNLHLNISANDMSLANATKEYYATDAEAKSYEDNETDGTKTIASVELTGGETTTKYSCTAKLTVSRVTEEENADTMVEVLQPGDMILQFKGNIISNKLDLSDLKTTGSKEYNLKFKVTGNTPEEIQAYIKLVNKEEQQNYLAGSKLNIDIDTSELKCEVFIEDPKIAQLRAKDIEVSNGIEHLSPFPNQGGMYRYQGTNAVPNWICFGTTDKEQCTNEDTGIDKYMYRIIGITEEGQMYLLKETFLKEGETTNKFAWNSKYSISDCLGEACEWPNSDIYKRLNGTASNGNPIFVDNSYYEYMTKDGDWYNLIADHNWMYGDTNVTDSSVVYNGDSMYAIETGETTTTRWWPDEEQRQTTCSSSSKCTEKPYTWSKSKNVPAKIGLMYMHDIDYAYAACWSEGCTSRGNPGSITIAQRSWIHFLRDGYNPSSSYEWLLTRLGVRDGTFPDVYSRAVVFTGAMYYFPLNDAYSARPVFYLSSNAKIKDGDGTKSNPYILDVEE